MRIVAAPSNRTEDARLSALRRYAIMDTPQEADFDDIVAVAAQACDAPIALISLVDETRQWFKAMTGLGLTQTPRGDSFCAHAIQGSGLLVVPDTLLDARFADNILVTGEPGLRFYAGAPIETADGIALGTVCVLDTRPRAGLTAGQQATLRTLARQVMAQLELRRMLRQAAASEAMLMAAVTDRDALLREKDLLMQEVHHRVKNSLHLVRTIVSMQSRDVAEPATRAQLEQTAARIMTIAAVHDRLYRSGPVIEPDAALFLQGLVADLETSMAVTGARPIVLDTEPLHVPADRMTPLGLVVTELVTNAMKYGRGRILVQVRRVANGLELAVQDEGDGFPAGFALSRSPGLGMRLVTSLSLRDGAVPRLEPAVHASRVVTRLPC